VEDNREPGPDPFDVFPLGAAAWILQAHVDSGVFLPRWRQLFSFVDPEFVEALEEADQEQRCLVQGVVLTDTLNGGVVSPKLAFTFHAKREAGD
jgi:hypothetical protein